MGIRKISIERWGNLEIEFDKKGGGSTTHKWYDGSMKIYRKIINAKKEPDLSDIEGWIKDQRDAKKKDSAPCKCDDGLWSECD